MKYRNGFVSNSSSSSFVIDKKGLTKSQIETINKWIEESREPCDYDNPKYADENTFNELDKHYWGTISYHVNFFEFLKEIGVPSKNIDSGD